MPYVGSSLGGDTFVINGNRFLTVSMIGDMSGHGERGRKRLKPLERKLKELSQI